MSLRRRGSILLSNLISLFALAFMSFSKMAGYLEMLMFGRFLIGLFCGLTMTLVPLYIQEVAPTHLRGAFSTLNQLSYTIGVFIGQILSLENVLGTPNLWPVMLSLSFIPGLIQCLTLPFCPESPRYLFINSKKAVEAMEVLQTLRGTQNVLTEMAEIREEATRLRDTPVVTMCQLFSVPSYRMRMVISLIIITGIQLSGYHAIINYSTRLFKMAKVGNPMHTTLGVGVINIIFTVLSVFLVERVGRRTLLIIGLLVMALCNILLTVSIAILSEAPWMTYLMVLAVFILVAFYAVGPGPISWYITAELFSQDARPVAMGVTSSWNWLNKFVVGMFYPPLRRLIGPYVFFCFALILVIISAFTYFRVPETRGRTFVEISAVFRQADPILKRKSLEK